MPVDIQAIRAAGGLSMPAPPRGPFHTPRPTGGRPPAGPFGAAYPAHGTPSFQNAPVGGPVYTGQPHPPQGVLAHPTTPAAPGAAPGAAPAPAPAAPGLPYLDSTYYMNVANNDFRVNNLIAGLEQREAYGNDDLQRALLQLTHNAALQERQDREQANNAGLLSSTALAGTLGEHARSVGDQRTSLQTQNSRSNASILSQINAARGGLQLFDEAQRLAAAQRQAAADAANPALGEPVPGASSSPPPTPPSTPPPGPPPGPPLPPAVLQAIRAQSPLSTPRPPAGPFHIPRPTGGRPPPGPFRSAYPRHGTPTFQNGPVGGPVYRHRRA